MNTSVIKSLLYNLILGSMILFVVFQLMSGIETSGQIIYWAMMFAVFFVAIVVVPQMLKFFTIPKNFFTYWLTSSIVSFIAIYAMSLFLPGISIGETVIDPVSAGIISIDPFTLSPILTTVLASLLAGLLAATLFGLQKE